jgi:hypothetical protein
MERNIPELFAQLSDYEAGLSTGKSMFRAICEELKAISVDLAFLEEELEPPVQNFGSEKVGGTD